MYKTKTMRTTVWVMSLVVLLAACRKKDADLGEMDNLVNFEVSSQGMSPSETSSQVKLKLSRAVRQDASVIVSIVAEGLTYESEFTTTPAPVGDKITVTIPSGASEATITVNKNPDALFDGDEKLNFDIYSSTSPVVIGANKKFTLSFAELVAQTSSAMLDGGGPNYPNKVFVDLSANRSTPVNRNTWDLGFYSGSEYRVILNSSMQMMVRQIDKNDLAQVTAADTVGFSEVVAFSSLNPLPSQMAYIDHPSGDLTRTAIAEISANAADNKVYIINRGMTPGPNSASRGWKKIRIVRNNNGGYTLQHADIASSTFQEVQIAKDPAYFFKYASLETGAVNVEPPAAKWDIAWTYFANAANFGSGDAPYMYQDVIVQNRNVGVAKVLTSTVSFDAFGEANLAGLTFNNSQISIGTDWRAGGGPGSAPAAYDNRFYIVRDGDGNYYKIRFTGLTNSSNERGYPSYEAVLVKAG